MAAEKNIKKIVLAYSGGLDTSVMLKWLIENYGCEVVTFTADLGQGEELSGIKGKALATGAIKAYVQDVKEEFVRDFVFPAFRANAVYEGGYLLGTALARPLIAKKQVEVASWEGANAVAHGATGKGNDQVRFELSYQALCPGIKAIAPWREWELKSRQALIAYAREKGIPVGATSERPYSIDRNLLHCSYEGGLLEDPWQEPEEAIYELTISPEKAPEKATYLEMAFQEGNPIAINGEKMSSALLLATLNKIGGENGIGRLDMVENRYVGIKCRGVYETPGGTIWRTAHQAVEAITLDREVMHLRDSMIPRYSELVYYGYWYSPERELLQKLFDEAQGSVTGVARLKLYKGNCQVVGRKAEASLYEPQYATFEEDTVYQQKDAEGFIKINALRLKIGALLGRQR